MPHARVFLLCSSLLFASAATAVPAFEDEWRAASAFDAQPPAYWERLQAYFDAHASADDRCQEMLEDSGAARLLLAFDARGRLTVRGEGVHAAAEDCAARAFLDHPPPRPDSVPFVLPFRLQR